MQIIRQVELFPYRMSSFTTTTYRRKEKYATIAFDRVHDVSYYTVISLWGLYASYLLLVDDTDHWEYAHVCMCVCVWFA